MCVFGGRSPQHASAPQRGHYLRPQPQLCLTLTNPEIHSEQCSWMIDLSRDFSRGAHCPGRPRGTCFMVNLGLTFPKAGWGCCAPVWACSALAQSHFLIAASTRLPAEPRRAQVLGWVPPSALPNANTPSVLPAPLLPPGDFWVHLLS